MSLSVSTQNFASETYCLHKCTACSACFDQSFKNSPLSVSAKINITVNDDTNRVTPVTDSTHMHTRKSKQKDRQDMVKKKRKADGIDRWMDRCKDRQTG